MSNIKDKLPKRWAKILVESTDYSRATVINVVQENKIEHELWPHVLNLAKDYQARLSELQNETDAIAGNKTLVKHKLINP